MSKLSDKISERVFFNASYSIKDRSVQQNDKNANRGSKIFRDKNE